MRHPDQNARETRERVVAMQTLGQTLRESLGPTEQEPLPQSMAILLLQLALAEVLMASYDEDEEGATAAVPLSEKLSRVRLT